MQHTREDRVVAGAGDAAAIPHITQMQDLALFSRDDAERITRAHVQCAYLGDRVALTRMLSSVKFFVDTSDLGFGSHVLLDGYWEMWLTLFCLRNVTPGMVAVDVGANFGYYTLLFANNVGATGHVIAVEPNSRAAALLRRSVELNGFSSRTLVEETACAEQNGLRFRLVVPADEPKNAHIVELSAQADGADRDLVVSRTLESLCAGLDRLDFIKIDAEGAEERIAIGNGRHCQEISAHDRHGGQRQTISGCAGFYRRAPPHLRAALSCRFQRLRRCCDTRDAALDARRRRLARRHFTATTEMNGRSRDMPYTVLYDGLNLSLKAGTGVATYTRGLIEVARNLGYRTTLLHPVNGKLPRDPVLREVLLFDDAAGREPFEKVPAAAMAATIGRRAVRDTSDRARPRRRRDREIVQQASVPSRSHLHA